jgi:uncharacterized membrane protein
MEKKTEIHRVKLDLKSYIKMTFVIGLCLGILGTILNLGLDLFSLIFNLFFGPPGGELSAHFSFFVLGLPSSFVSLLAAPVSMIVVGLITYPIYKYITNRFFTFTISVYGDVEH